MNNIKYYKDRNGGIMASVIPSSFSTKGVKFITDDESFMQVAYMGHDAGHVIQPHYHNPASRKVKDTCETLIIKKGLLRVSLYDEKVLVNTFDLCEGDILTLYSGGHGFKVIKDVEMVEIKQGPYLGINDKTRF